jgi:hypothetical protein
MQGTNTPAYYCNSVNNEGKNFITLTADVNVIELFFFITNVAAKYATVSILRGNPCKGQTL